MSGYRGGHILRIKVENFMTYDELELFPQHGLNLIIGLNGSGKSSIMCAVCLGLAGKPQFTGRTGQLSDFIKYGCEKATVEIELENPSKRNIVITRIIHGDRSTWLLNKSSVSHHEIQNVVKKFNIDVSNLCQFLPQEKVIEFSKMDKKQRLENMLQAIGEPRLFSLFKDLKQLKVDSIKLEETIRRHQMIKDEEGQINQRLKVDVDKHEDNLRMKSNLVSLQQHKLILEYQELCSIVQGMKNEKKPLEKQEFKLRKENTGLEKSITDQTRLSDKALQNIQELNKKICTLQNEITRRGNELEHLHEKADNAKIHFQNRIEEKRNQKSKLIEIERQIQALQELHKKNLETKPRIEERDRAVTAELDTIKTNLSSLSSDHARTNLEKNRLEYTIREKLIELERMKNEENKKMEFLKQRFRDVYQAVVWLNENRHRFRAPVYSPMYLLLKVKNDEDRKYIENTVAVRDFVAFMCENKEDSILLTQILKLQMKLKVNIVMVPDNPIECYKSPDVTPNLRRLGIQCFLKETVDAPEAVMRYLCQCFGLHKIPLCATDAHMNEILIEFKTFFIADARISGKHSKYGARNLCIRRDAIRSKNFLSSCKDHSDRLEVLQSEAQTNKCKMDILVAQLQKFEDQIKGLERKENTLRDEKKALHEKLKDFENTERQLRQKFQSYERKKNELVNEEEEKMKVTLVIQEINSTKIKICDDISSCLEEFVLFKSEKLKNNLKARAILKVIENLSAEKAEKTEELKNIKIKIDEIAKKKDQIKKEAMAMYKKIEEFLSKDKDMKQKFQEICSTQWRSLSCLNISKYEMFGHLTKEEVEQSIRRTQAQLSLNCEENEAIVIEYNKREKHIQETQKDIDGCKGKLEQLQATMAQKKNQWLPSLEKHINNINKKFCQYYKQLKCAGEITLDTCNNSDDFPQYGLQITLKYRDNEPFMELSNTHHSGGECSVAAIIFILSLQELTEVPFRCIDEINQGMDSQNERNIYNLIADSAKNGSCSQYFLLTPKLLMDLEMIEHRDVAVHVIFNSLFLNMKLDVGKHIKLTEEIRKA